MAAKSRTVDPALFQKPDFLRATYVAREVWLGMICACADDEGRLEADPWGLAEKLFSRSHEAADEDVAQALQYWQEVGWLTLYGEDRYGFLNGWFEHQYIRKPEPSSYPAPPVLVASWRDVQQVKVWYMEQRGGMDNTHLRTMLRDFAQAVCTNSALSAQVLRTESVDATLRKGKGKGKGSEGEREGERARMLTQYAEHDRALIEGFLANCADENATKRITTARAISEIVSLDELRLKLMSEDEGKGEERWRYGLSQANRAGAPNLRYVEKAARNWKGQNGLAPTTGPYAPRQDPTRPMGPTDNSEFGKTEKGAAPQ